MLLADNFLKLSAKRRAFWNAFFLLLCFGFEIFFLCFRFQSKCQANKLNFGKQHFSFFKKMQWHIKIIAFFQSAAAAAWHKNSLISFQKFFIIFSLYFFQFRNSHQCRRCCCCLSRITYARLKRKLHFKCCCCQFMLQILQEVDSC